MAGDPTTPTTSADKGKPLDLKFFQQTMIDLNRIMLENLWWPCPRKNAWEWRY
jgi:hypothetical protein